MKKIFLIILLSFNSLSTVSAKPQQPHSPVMAKLYKILSLTPAEVTHDMSIARSATGAYHLDETRIEKLKMNYARNFQVRAHLAKATYAITAGSLLWIGYKWGAFDWILSSKQEPIEIPKVAAPTIVDSSNPALVPQFLKDVETYLVAHDSTYTKLDAIVKASNEEKAGNWFINGAKYVGWTGITIIGGLLVQSKWHAIFNYVLAEPSFRWFLSNHTIISTVEGLKRNVQALTSPQLTAGFSHDYHALAIDPTLESIVKNIEQYIAFTDFYLDQLDEDIVHAQAMDSVPRYLFNLTNDFLAKINSAIVNTAEHASAAAIVDEFKADMITCINRCKVFEKEFVEAV